MIKLAICAALAITSAPAAVGAPAPERGIASWYGEAHRGKLMANGKKFNPERLTAASWFYPLGTRVKVSVQSGKGSKRTRSVYVTVTDRGPAHDLVRDGRIIDLAQAAFRRLAHLDLGLVPVTVQPVGQIRFRSAALSRQPIALKKAA